MNFRYAVRTLLRTPGFAAIAIFTLALGIGINTLVFSIFESVVMKPIAARAPGELIRITTRQDGPERDEFSYGELEQIRTGTSSLVAVIATSAPQTIVGTMGGQPNVMRARLVSGNYFDALGVAPGLGRAFAPGEVRVAVVSYSFWQRTLHGDPAVLSQSIRVHNALLAIVGVAPENFAGTGVPPQMPDLWIPMEAQPEVLPGADWLHGDTSRQWQMLARRKPSIGVKQASAELEVLARGWPLVHGEPAHLTARAATFFQTDSGEMETFAYVCGVLMAAVGLILLIGSINLVNLLFARHTAREHEFAVRMALGARRRHLIRQLCSESLLLGICGGVAGLLFSMWACEWTRAGIDRVLQRVSNGALSFYVDLRPDWRVFAFTAAVSILVGLAIGLWPAVWASRRNISSDLKTAPEGYRKLWSKRGLLIAAQVGACLMLLAAAGMLFRGVWRSSEVNPGFETHHLMLMAIDARALTSTPAARLELLRHAMERVQDLPQVTSVAFTDRPPFLGHSNAGFETEKKALVRSLFAAVSDRYFETMGLTLVAGRTFTREEVERDAPVVVISDVTARAAWPGEDPLGHRISGVSPFLGFNHDSAIVVGVVKAVRSTWLSKPDHGFVYHPIKLAGGLPFLVRTRELPETASRAIMSTLAGIDPNLPSQTTLLEMEKGPMEIQRLMAQAPAVAATVLGAIALLLAALGVFALVAQLVARRTREIAIRVSLGAASADVVSLILAQTLRPVILGSIVGMAGALGISALLRSMIIIPDMPDLTYGAGAFAPEVFAASWGALLVVVLLASFVPVQRATRIHPAEALRSE